MDFIKKIAQEQLSGDKDQQHQQQQYGPNQNQGGNFGGQGGFGQNDFQGQGQGGYGGQQGGFGGQAQQFTQTGGPQYSAPHGSGGAGQGGGGGLASLMGMFDQQATVSAANEHASNGNDNASMFSSALSMFSGKAQQGEDLDGDGDVDMDDLRIKNERAYQQGQGSSMSANSMGSAAALQAMKMFTSGQSGAANSNSGGNMQSKLLGMAMSEAVKLFDKSGGAASGNKQDAVNSAAGTIMKLMIKSQFTGGMGGGNSGGLGQLMGMASKFM